VEEHAVEHGEERHGDAADDAAPHAGGVGVDLDRQPGAVSGLADLQVRHLAADERGRDLRLEGHRLVVLHG